MKDGADEMQVESDEMETDDEEDVSDWENKEQNTSKILRYLKEYQMASSSNHNIM